MFCSEHWPVQPILQDKVHIFVKIIPEWLNMNMHNMAEYWVDPWLTSMYV